VAGPKKRRKRSRVRDLTHPRVAQRRGSDQPHTRGLAPRKQKARKINHLKMRAQKHMVPHLEDLQQRTRPIELHIALVVLGTLVTSLELPNQKSTSRADQVELGSEGIRRVVKGEHPVTVATALNHEKKLHRSTAQK